MIDLQQFCSRDRDRPYLHKPWSIGDFTYATNGHVLVRVDRRSDAPENDRAPGIDSLNRALNLDAAKEFVALPKFAFPDDQLQMRACSDCAGSGKDDNGDTCDTCHGAGQHAPERSVALHGVLFDARYIARIALLPAIEIIASPVQVEDGSAPFRFTGGIGALMALRWHYPDHLGEMFP